MKGTKKIPPRGGIFCFANEARLRRMKHICDVLSAPFGRMKNECVPPLAAHFNSWGAQRQLSAFLGSPFSKGELDFVAAKRQQKTERIFVCLTVGILTAFICRHRGVREFSQSRRFNPLSPRQLSLRGKASQDAAAGAADLPRGETALCKRCHWSRI